MSRNAILIIGNTKKEDMDDGDMFDYENMKWDLEQSARQYHCSIYELRDPRHEYPEEIVW